MKYQCFVLTCMPCGSCICSNSPPTSKKTHQESWNGLADSNRLREHDILLQLQPKMTNNTAVRRDLDPGTQLTKDCRHYLQAVSFLTRAHAHEAHFRQRTYALEGSCAGAHAHEAHIRQRTYALEGSWAHAHEAHFRQRTYALEGSCAGAHAHEAHFRQRTHTLGGSCAGANAHRKHFERLPHLPEGPCRWAWAQRSVTPKKHPMLPTLCTMQAGSI
eukprot:1161449-Pelagomonas_calceolata.AAC.7